MTTTQTATINNDHVETGKAFAILSYLVPFFFLVPLIQKRNPFAQFHARQALAIIVVSILLTLVAYILPLALLRLASPVFLLIQVALIVFGVLHAARGQATPLPVVGPHAERVCQCMRL